MQWYLYYTYDANMIQDIHPSVHFQPIEVTNIVWTTLFASSPQVQADSHLYKA